MFTGQAAIAVAAAGESRGAGSEDGDGAQDGWGGEQSKEGLSDNSKDLTLSEKRPLRDFAEELTSLNNCHTQCREETARVGWASKHCSFSVQYHSSLFP